MADLTLDSQILRTAAEANFYALPIAASVSWRPLSLRAACLRVLGHPRSTQRYVASLVEDEKALTEEIVALSSQFGKDGYRRVAALLRHRGWRVNHKQV